MLLFLRETWELFWWAMFCPSRLQQRMNEWSPQEEKDGRRPDTSFFDILLFRNFRFISQYLLLLFISNIPLILKLIERNQLLDWLQLPCVMLIAYMTGVLFLPLGLVIPLLWLIVVLNQPDRWLKGLIEARKVKVLPLLFQMQVGATGVVTGVATLPLTWFSIVASLIAFALAPVKGNTVFIITPVILIALSVQNLKWHSALITPVTLVSYYRIFPDYSFISLGSYYTLFIHYLLKLFRFSDSTIRWLRPQTAKILFQLPPYTSELLWIPLPNHAQLLVSEFRERPQQALTIFQYTQTFSLPGFQITLQNALPQIVADQLKQIQSIPELIFTANSDHPILPFLISPFYHLDSDSDTPTPETPLPKVKPELSILLPHLQTIIRGIQSALENKNIPLQERGLKEINKKLKGLKSQLPSLGLKHEAIKRWTPVLEHWQSVIELELEQNEQSKLSQGGLINPFQYGNPVRLDQKNLFKGRQRFANEVVRRVLDRDRPTLVLHGPRRCGKTSFLYNFPRLLPSDILPVFVDMQSSAITTSESDFCFGLVRAIHKDCKSQNVQLPNIPKRTDFKDSPYPTLEDWLDEALAQIGERRILLNLDEFEKTGTAIQKGQITLRLFDELRHLIQHYEKLGFLFSGVQTLEELGPNWSSYFISVVPIEMLYLEPNEAEELLLNPDPAFTLRYAPGIVKEVLKLTNCHPYCLQLLGASMVNQANFNHTDFITFELLQASINDAFISGQPYFTNIWTEFTGTTPEEMVIGQELLLQVARTDILLPRTAEIAEKVLTRLLRYHILHKINGGYDFEIPLLKEWVRDRAVRS
ncbi:AAA family ATPase [Nostoc sp.]|uniref:AAA family ATPase n=1 Tax=Nostoc sp. TaxID=1180 RepID=UPI002FF8C790